MGCKCEPGYSGPNCANKMCKYGIDPLYIDDDMMTVRTATARVILSFDNSTIDAGDATYQPYASGDETLSMAGTYAIKFYDAFGEDYETEALSVDASCDEITAALEGMANSVIPANGVSGEFVDYFPTYCPGVTIGVAESGSKAEKKAGGFSYATGLTSDEEKALKACLGDADGNPDNNVEVYNWDKGLVNETSNPHLVKLAPHPTSGANPKVDAYDAGKYYLLYFGAYDGDFDATDGGSKFYFSGLPDVDRDYIVFPTEGTATVLGNDTDSSASRAPITAYFGKGTTTVYTSMDVSCDSGVTPLNACLNKGDKVFLFNNQPDGHENTALTTYSEGLVKDSSSTGNMYEVVKVGKKGMSSVTPYVEDRFYFVVDKVINWDGSALAPRSSFEDGTLSAAALGYTELGNLAYPQSQKVGLQSVVKFDVSNAASYEFVSQCSGRGLCNGDTGLCECFAGYTNDNCDLQSALAS